ncbi:MAG: prepilin-type N-terminal cleavage/methylation domain-containing protein [Deltaproteobacteria bacterium]|nr:prepilin-type N-terminal cleavage/methylation domain-containing protein [Deltaproteobacteria bacterium]
MKQDSAYTKNNAIRKSKKDEGFTLIEVLIAISIFAIGMLAVATMQISAIKVNSNAGKITTRITWAQDKLEKLMALPYTDSQLQAAGSPFQETTSDGYIVSWTVTDNTPITNTKLITVTVTGQGKTTRVSYVKPSMS